MATVHKFEKPAIHRRARTSLDHYLRIALQFNRDVSHAPSVLIASGALFLLFETLPPFGTGVVPPLELFSGEWRTVGVVQWLLVLFVWKSYRDGEVQVTSLSFPVRNAQRLRTSLHRHLLLIVSFAPLCSIGVEIFPTLRSLLANNRTDFVAPILWAVLGIVGLGIATSFNRTVGEIGQRNAFDKLINHRGGLRHGYGHRGLREVSAPGD